MTNKRKSVVAITLLLLSVIIIIGVLSILKGSSNTEAKLSKKMEREGAKFYTEFYYDQITVGKNEEEITSFLSSFEEHGIKIDLENLSKFNSKGSSDLSSEFTNSIREIQCDTRNSKVIIFPESPFKKSDFSLRVELDCGFTE